MAGNAADLHHGDGAGISQHHRHLQQHAEEVADVVGAVLGEALGTVAALEQEGVAGRNAPQGLLQVARLAGEHQRRKGRKLRLDVGQSLGVGIFGHL
ncbi:phytoene/squalene synthetase [Bradyrhizobium liaoningense]